MRANLQVEYQTDLERTRYHNACKEIALRGLADQAAITEVLVHAASNEAEYFMTVEHHLQNLLETAQSFDASIEAMAGLLSEQ